VLLVVSALAVAAAVAVLLARVPGELALLCVAVAVVSGVVAFSCPRTARADGSNHCADRGAHNGGDPCDCPFELSGHPIIRRPA